MPANRNGMLKSQKMGMSIARIKSSGQQRIHKIPQPTRSSRIFILRSIRPIFGHVNEPDKTCRTGYVVLWWSIAYIYCTSLKNEN